ncbi:hypothetical protein IC621_01080 [Bacillus sp. IB182487]|uniref:YqhR n=2 Tax=Metabacillus arenae TaxID=2771434 RepID=A0A926NDF4_9BACI|nr:hypothetical protein [Metabacillus arenae]
MKENPRFEQNKQEQPISFLGRVMVTGFFGGILWSLFGYIAYIFNFSEVSPNLLLQPFILGSWKDGTLGNFVSIVLIGVLGVGAAIAYYAVLKRFNKLWIGIGYGIALWGLVYFVLNPIFPDLKTVMELKRETIVTTVCLYILFGVFVGYSISFEYNELTTEKLERATNPGIK